MNCPDNYDAFARHDAEQERAEKNWVKGLPICPWCDKPIRTDICFVIGDEIVCEDCIDECKDYTENHMRR